MHIYLYIKQILFNYSHKNHIFNEGNAIAFNNIRLLNSYFSNKLNGMWNSVIFFQNLITPSLRQKRGKIKQKSSKIQWYKAQLPYLVSF